MGLFRSESDDRVEIGGLAGRQVAEQQAGGESAEEGEQHRFGGIDHRSEEHTSELQSLMRISYAVFCLKKKTQITRPEHKPTTSLLTQHNNKVQTTPEQH